jgi:hypothetical protein
VREGCDLFGMLDREQKEETGRVRCNLASHVRLRATSIYEETSH